MDFRSCALAAPRCMHYGAGGRLVREGCGRSSNSFAPGGDGGLGSAQPRENEVFHPHLVAGRFLLRGAFDALGLVARGHPTEALHLGDSFSGVALNTPGVLCGGEQLEALFE